MKKVVIIVILFLFLPQITLAAKANKVYLKVNKTEIVKGNQVKVYGYVIPKKKNVKIRIYRQRGGNWKYIKTKRTKKKGRFNYYTRPSSDTYYRAKIRGNKKWKWGNKKKQVTVRDYPSCGNSDSYFSELVLDTDDFKSLSPLGATNPTGHVFPTDHMYFYLTDGMTQVPIYSPGKAWVTSISASTHLYATPVFTDYSIGLWSCSELYSWFGHVSSLSAELEAAYNAGSDEGCNEYTTGGNDYRYCIKTVHVKVTAGEQIGTAGGNSGQGALDLGTYDTRREITGVANEERWEWNAQTLYNACPLDYYDATNKSALEAYLGDGTTYRTVEPLCGTIHQDVSGTAQGRWFLEGTEVGDSGGEDNHLALIHNNVDFATGEFSVGNAINSLSSGEYTFTPTFSGYVDRDFDEVTADGQIYCYEAGAEYILIQLTSATTLRIEAQNLGSCGSGPWGFTDDYTDFER